MSSAPIARGIRDVAARAGVSTGTVSNVLNNPAVVAPRTRAKVETAIKDLGFVRNGLARQLRAGRSRAVGAIVLDIANPFFTEVIRGAEHRLAEDDLSLVICNSDDSAEREERYIRLLEEQRALGLLLTPATDSLRSADALRAKGIPVVLLDSNGPTNQFCSVAVDDVLGAELAAGHLIANGHRRIGFINGPVSLRQCLLRREGLHRAVAEAGGAVTLTEVTAPSLNADGGEIALSRLQSQGLPSAIFCANDVAALGVLRSLARQGIRVPQDVAVVGYDDVEFAAMLSPSLTSVRQPMFELGRAATELLLAEARAGSHKHETVLFRPELIVRASSDMSRPVRTDGTGSSLI